MFPYLREILGTLLASNNRVKKVRGEFDQTIAMSDPHADGPDYIDRISLPKHVKAALKYTWEKLGHDGGLFHK